jgi:hypothetical protein
VGEKSDGDKRVEEWKNRSEGTVLRVGRKEGREEGVYDGRMKKMVKQ